jgi:nucleoside-diphosphate-sugar epimerase
MFFLFSLDVVFHLAALVGPYYEKSLYFKVNHEGSLIVLDACRFHKIPRLVQSTSPSTRFTGKDVRGMREEQMPILKPGQFLEPYAESKAMGEVAIRNACCDELMTVAVAPHQVYGPRDGLFLSNFLGAADSGRLRVFGPGDNLVSVCYVDNYCHGLILGYQAMYKGSPALGKYYVITDGGHYKLWRFLDEAIVGMGYPSVFSKFHLPIWFLFALAYVLLIVGKIVGTKFKLTPFAVTMMTIDRWFDITNAEEDLGYKPVVEHDEAWSHTIKWFKDRPEFWKARSANSTAKALSKQMK